MNRTETLAVRTLLTMARQRLGLAETRAAAVIDHTGLNSSLHEALARHQLSELQFDLLVVLFALEPRPVAPSDLAHYAGFNRSSVSSALGAMHARGCLVAHRAPDDHRNQDICLTASGRQLTEAAISDYLQALALLTTATPGDPTAALPSPDFTSIPASTASSARPS